MRIPQISGKKLIKILSQNGFIPIRQRGDHVRLEKKTHGKTIKLTVPLHDTLKKGTFSRIIKDAGLEYLFR